MPDETGASALAAAIAGNPRCAAVYVDTGGYIRSWNSGAETLFGHAAAEAIGRRADLIVPPSDHDAHWSGFERAVASPWRGSAGWDPIEPLHRDGMTRALEVFLTPVHGPAGALRGVLAFFRERAEDS